MTKRKTKTVEQHDYEIYRATKTPFGKYDFEYVSSGELTDDDLWGDNTWIKSNEVLIVSKNGRNVRMDIGADGKAYTTVRDAFIDFLRGA